MIDEEPVRMEEDDDPCWDGYEQYGMKTKDGREVPNCIPEDQDDLEEGIPNPVVDSLVGEALRASGSSEMKSESMARNFNLLKLSIDDILQAFKNNGYHFDRDEFVRIKSAQMNPRRDGQAIYTVHFSEDGEGNPYDGNVYVEIGRDGRIIGEF